MKCNFIGIGVQKSASTWVYRVLEDHPQASMSDPKELDYFSYNFDKGNDWYEGHFHINANSRVLGDISPSYFNSVDAVQNAKSYNENLKIIVTLRDPINRAYSNHLHLLRLGEDYYKGQDDTFESGMKAHPEYLEQSFYFRHLSKWFSLFPRDNILVMLQEEIERDPILHAKKLYSFLQINESHESGFLYKKANVSHEPKIKAIESSLKLIAKGGRKLGLENAISKIKNNSYIQAARDKNKKHISSRVPPIQKETQAKLLTEVSSDLISLSALLGRDFSVWESWSTIKTWQVNG